MTMRPPLELTVRAATPADAPQAVAVLRACITHSCVLDHQNDAEILERWLRNKQPEIFLSWLDDPASTYLVATADERIYGVGGAHCSGEIRLCYVDPGAERRGVGSALLHGLEGELEQSAVAQVTLQSSATARGFYERRGYVSSGIPTAVFRCMLAYPYAKAIVRS
jgi:GNAT superfamily N-acetyltransferase